METPEQRHQKECRQQLGKDEEILRIHDPFLLREGYYHQMWKKIPCTRSLARLWLRTLAGVDRRDGAQLPLLQFRRVVIHRDGALRFPAVKHWPLALLATLYGFELGSLPLKLLKMGADFDKLAGGHYILIVRGQHGIDFLLRPLDPILIHGMRRKSACHEVRFLAVGVDPLEEVDKSFRIISRRVFVLQAQHIGFALKASAE